MTALRFRWPRARAPLHWPPALRYGVALALVALTAGLVALINGDWLFFRSLRIDNPGTAFVAPVALIAVFLGTGPAIAAVIASVFCGQVWFWPNYSGSRLTVLVLTMFVIIALAEAQRRAQVQGERAQAKFEAIIAGMSDAVMVVDVAGNPTDVNHAAISMLGARDHADALDRISRVRADGTPTTDEFGLLLRALAGEESPQADVLIPDGTDGGRTVSAVANTLRDQRGRIIGAVSVSRDLTERLVQARERERLHQQVERERAFTEHVFANLPVGIAVLRAEDFTVLSFNEEYDASVRAAQGSGTLAVGKSFFAAIPKESHDAARRLLAVARDERQPLRHSGYSSPVAPDRFYDGTIQPLTLSDGTEALLITSVNVTERVIAERERERLLGEIERERQFTRLILDTVPVSIAVLRPDDLTVLTANANFEGYVSRLAGQPFTAGERLTDPLPGLEGSQFIHDIRGAVAENRPISVTGYAAVAPVGHYYDWTMQPLPLSDGGIGTLVTFADVTERVEGERERERLLGEVERQAAQLAATLDAMLDGISVYDTEGNVLRRNAAFYRLLHMDPESTSLVWEEFIRTLDLRLPNGMPLAREQTHSWRALHGETVRGEIVRLRDGLGGDRFVNQNASPIRTADGTIFGAVVVFNDVTERLEQEREREELLRLVEERRRFTQAIFETVPVSLAVIDAGTMTFRTGNPAFVDGLPQPYSDLGVNDAPLLAVLPHAEGNGFADQVRRVGETGTPLSLASTRYEHPRRGTTWWNETMIPFQTTAVETPHVLYIAADVTEQVTAEQRASTLALVAAERASQLEAVIGSLAEGLLIADVEGKILQSNGALRELLGLDADEPLPHLPDFVERFAMRSASGEIMPPAERAGPLALRGEVRTDELRRFRTARGEDRWMSVNAVPIRDSGGTITGIAMTLRDATERLEQQRQIAAHASQLEAVFASLTEGLVLSDTEGNILQSNAAVRRMLGLADDAPLPPFPAWGERYALRTVPPIEDITAVRAWARARQGETVIDERRQFRTVQGDDRWMSVNASPVRDDAGAITGMALTLRDVTEQLGREQEREQLLAEIEERRRFAQTVIENATVGIAVFATDPEFTVRIANDQYAQLLDEPWRSRGVVGVGIREYLPGAEENNIPAIFSRVVASGEGFSTREFEYVGFARGTVYFDWSIVPLRESGDRVTGLLAIATEVTDRVLSQQRIEELADAAARRAAELEAVFTSIPVGLAIHAKDGTIAQMNATGERLTGGPIAADQSIGEVADSVGVRYPDGALAPPEELPVPRALGGETVTGVELMTETPEGSRYFLSGAAPIRDAAGEIVGAVVSFNDITPLKQLEQMKDEFISIAAHELRTPLTAIKGYTDLLDRRMSIQAGRDRDRQSLAIIRRQTDRLTSLVNEMLDVSRIEAGRLLLNYEHFDLTVLVQEVVTNLRPSTDAHRFTIEAEPGIEIEADATRVEQVLINLISNAITYSPEGGDVAVRVWRDGGTAKIAVRDTGVGIAPDELPHLFERFYRAPRAGVMRSGGMGLGLYISNEIVHRHGGTIAVESAEGAGSTFTVTLPLTGKD